MDKLIEEKLKEFVQITNDNLFYRAEYGGKGLGTTKTLEAQIDFLRSALPQVYRAGVEAGAAEERQFTLNILDGVDIADRQMDHHDGTRAIRLALQSRVLPKEDTHLKRVDDQVGRAVKRLGER